MFEAIASVENYFLRHLSTSTYNGDGVITSDLLWEYALLKHTSDQLQLLYNEWCVAYPELVTEYMGCGFSDKSPLRISTAMCTALARLKASPKLLLYQLISAQTPTFDDSIGRLVIERPELSIGDILRAASTHADKSVKRAGLLVTLLRVRNEALTEEALYAIAELSAPGIMIQHVCDHPRITGDIMVYYYQKAKAQGVDETTLAHLEQRLMRVIG